MRRHITAAALAALLLATSGPARARAAAGDDIQQVWAAFRTAVAANDKARVMSLMRFPVQGWDEHDLGTEITKEEFSKAYAKAFTPAVKNGIAHGTPVAQQDGSYTVEWRGGKPAHRYTLVFENGEGGFRCVALATGD